MTMSKLQSHILDALFMHSSCTQYAHGVFIFFVYTSENILGKGSQQHSFNHLQKSIIVCTMDSFYLITNMEAQSSGRMLSAPFLSCT